MTAFPATASAVVQMPSVRLMGQQCKARATALRKLEPQEVVMQQRLCPEGLAIGTTMRDE